MRSRKKNGKKVRKVLKDMKMQLSMSLQIAQKPTLLECNETNETDPGCYRCYRLNPDGFYCPMSKKTKEETASGYSPKERETLEDHTSF
jgi:hypothetical protein